LPTINPPKGTTSHVLVSPPACEFNSTRAGEIAAAVASKGFCEANIDDGKGSIRRCGEPATGTVDVDIFGILEHFPVCGNPIHRRALRLDLVTELAAQGHVTVPGENGFGRE
jgi:hypothetical protein